MGTPRQFETLEPILLDDGITRVGSIGKSRIRIVEARLLVERTLALLKKDKHAVCATKV